MFTQVGQPTSLCCDAVHGGGAKREQWHLLHSLPDFSHSLRYPQSNWAPVVLIPEWVGSRPLWVSPKKSPMRLGVSPTDTSTCTGVFNQRFEALFPGAGALRRVVCFAPPPFLPVYLCMNVEPWGLLAAAWPVLFHYLPPR